MAAACVLVLLACGFCIQRAGAQSATSTGTTANREAGGTKAADPAAPKASSSNANAAKNQTATSAPAKKKSGSSPAASHKSKTKLASSRTGGTRSSGKKTSRKKATARGQQKIDPERAQAIQEALIREHYLSGEAARNLESGQRRRHAALSGRSRLAIENGARFAGADQPGAGTEPRSSAESGERDDHRAGYIPCRLGKLFNPESRVAQCRSGSAVQARRRQAAPSARYNSRESQSAVDSISGKHQDPSLVRDEHTRR